LENDLHAGKAGRPACKRVVLPASDIDWDEVSVGRAHVDGSRDRAGKRRVDQALAGCARLGVHVAADEQRRGNRDYANGERGKWHGRKMRRKIVGCLTDRTRRTTRRSSGGWRRGDGGLWRIDFVNMCFLINYLQNTYW
jgi:hypothetical protein